MTARQRWTLKVDGKWYCTTSLTAVTDIMRAMASEKTELRFSVRPATDAEVEKQQEISRKRLQALYASYRGT